MKNKKEIFILVLCYIVVFPSILYSQPSSTTEEDKILKYFQDEILNNENNAGIEILDTSYAKFNFIGGFADGKYKLKKYRITYIKDNIYRLELSFYKKKGVFRYNKDVVLYFWKATNTIVILSHRGKFRYTLSDTETKVLKTPDGYILKKEFIENIIRIPISDGIVYLKIKKNY